MSDKITAGEALVRILEEEGVEYVFGVPGSHSLPFYDALFRSDSIEAVLTKHEGGAAYMAKAYARASGKPGVCSGTAGPGALNTITGVADAYVDQVPMIVINGQVATSVFGRSGNQEVTGEHMRPDQVDIFRSITKHSSMVISTTMLHNKVREAFRLAMTEPFGPVHLCFPSDILGTKLEYEPLEPARYRPLSWKATDDDAIRKAAALIAGSSRPVIIAGHRATFPDASRELANLVDGFRIPVATTLVAKGIIPESHPLSLGCLDLFGHKLPDVYIKKADLIISVGEYFDEYSTVYYDPDLFTGKKHVQFDSYHAQIGKVIPVDVGIVGSIGTGLDRLADQLGRNGCGVKSDAAAIGAMKKELRHFHEPETLDESVPLKPQRVMYELNRALPTNSLVLCDVCSALFWAARHFPVEGPGRFFCSWGIKPVGSGAGGVAGLQLAARDKPVFCFCGDGGMQMNGMEIMTAVNLKLPVTWFVFNDFGLYMVRIAQGLSYSERYIATTMKNPDFVKLAEACGADGYRVTEPGQIEHLVPEILNKRKPAIVDIRFDSDEILPLKPRAVLKMKEMGLDVSSSPFAARALRKILDESRK